MRHLLVLLLVGAALTSCGGSSSSPVPLPPGAPVSLADCGWPNGTPLAFAEWVDEPGQAGLPDTFRLVSGERAFVIVTLGKISQQPMVGSAIVARGACVRFPDGHTTVGAVPDDWQVPKP